MAAAYNDCIRALAARDGYTVVEVAALLDELHADPEFPALRSQFLSPDLHHPCYRTHAAIATRVLDTMAVAAGAPKLPVPDPHGVPLPSAADLTSAAGTFAPESRSNRWAAAVALDPLLG